MKRIKRLVSLAMAGALLLGTTLFDAVSGAKAASKRITASSINAAETESDRKQSDAADAGKDSKSSKSREKDAAGSEKTEKKSSKKARESKKQAEEKAEKKSDSSEKEVRLTLSISKPGGLSASDGVYRVDPDAVKSLTLSWKCKGDCDSYEVSVSGGVYSATTGKTSAKVSVSGLSAGKYTATVKAIRDGKTVAKEKLSFRIVASDDEADKQASADKAEEAQPEEASQDTKVEVPVEDKQASDNDSSGEKSQPAAEEQPTEAQQAPAEEQPAEEQQAPKANPPAEEQMAPAEEQPAEEQPVSGSEQPDKEQTEQPTAQQTPESELPDEKQQTPTEEQPTEAQQSPEPVLPDEKQQSPTEKQPTEAQQSPEPVLPDEKQQIPAEEQPTEEQTSPDAEQSVEEEQTSGTEQKSPEPVLPAAEEITVEEAQSDAEEQSVEVGPATDEASQAVEETNISDDAPQAGAGNDPVKKAQDAATGQPVEVSTDADRAQPDIGTSIELSDRADSEDADLAIGIIPEDPFVADEQVAIEPLIVPEAAYDEALTAEAQPTDDVLPERPAEAVSANAGDSDKKGKTDNAVTLSILGAQGLTVMAGTVHVDPTQADAVTLVWQFGGTCDSYTVSVSGGVYSADTKKARLSLPVRGLAAGRYTATVTAVKDGKTLSTANVVFCVDEIGSEEAADPGLTLTVASPQGLLITEGVYQVDPTQVSELTLSWRSGDECEDYAVEVSEGVYSGVTQESTLTLPLAGLRAGTYTASVAARNGDETVALAQLDFAITGESEKQQEEGQEQGEGQKQGDQKPQGDGAPKGGGGTRGGSTAKGGEDDVAEQGFHITPGEALVTTHTSGSRDMRLYGAVELTVAEGESMTLLTLGGTALDIRLSDGGPFTASIEADALTLVPEGSAQAWLLNGQALKTLAISGIETLCLTLNDLTVDFPTTPLLTGQIYGALRSEGWASVDYCYAVDADGCRVTVADRTYRLTGEGELA